MAVCHFEDVIRGDIGVRGAGLGWRDTADQVVGCLVGVECNRNIGQRDVDLLALAGAFAFVQGRKDCGCGVHAGHEVDDGNTGADGTGAFFALGAAGVAHKAAHALEHVVITGVFSLRAGGTVAGDGHPDQFGVDFAQVVVVQAQAGQGAGLVVLNDDIGVLCQPLDDVIALFGAEVDGDGLLVAVGRNVVGRVAVFGCCAFEVGRTPAASVITGTGPFDLDDVGPQVGKILGAPRACQHAGKVENCDVLQ